MTMSYDVLSNALSPDEAAVVWSPNEGYVLIIPKLEKEKQVPDDVLAISAVMIRLNNDPQFRQEQIDWFKGQPRN